MKKLSKETKKRLSSRKLWLALTAAFVAFANSMWNWGLTPEEVWKITAPLLAYIGVEGLADAVDRI